MLFHIDERKITRYLLTSTSKSPFFLGAGYTLAHWTVLRDDLLNHPLVAHSEGIQPDQWGTKAVYRCEMPAAPNGRQYCVRTVWQLRADGMWTLVTAYPQQGPAARP